MHYDTLYSPFGTLVWITINLVYIGNLGLYVQIELDRITRKNYGQSYEQPNRSVSTDKQGK